ncbi:MAG: prepilin-type N-terminal cleavage/methylation domain-containing protein [Candidatus Portnoybacteria bacterium]|nr:prepilin-type N-terminal cleavage/methylation domain-containing protein [Candidatus Portnoybacteria bacterium]
MKKEIFPEVKKQFLEGFTLIEVLIAISIMALIGASIWAFQRDVISLNAILPQALSVQQESHRAFKKMNAEIRSLSLSATGAYPIVEASSTSFSFYGDIDNDNLKEQVRYFLEEGILKKGVIKPSGNPPVYASEDEQLTEVVHDVVSDSIFAYYDSSYDGTSEALAPPPDILAVRLVKIILMIDRDPDNPPAPQSMTTQVSMRNLKSNL